MNKYELEVLLMITGCTAIALGSISAIKSIRLRELKRRINVQSEYLKIAVVVIPELVEQIPGENIRLSRKTADNIEALSLFVQNDLI